MLLRHQGCSVIHQERAMVDPSDLLSVQKAAEILGLSGDQVRIYCRSGSLPATRIGQIWVIKRADLDAFTAQPRRSPGRPADPSAKYHGWRKKHPKDGQPD